MRLGLDITELAKEAARSCGKWEVVGGVGYDRDDSREYISVGQIAEYRTGKWGEVWDILHAPLRPFVGKRVRLTIEVLGDIDK